MFSIFTAFPRGYCAGVHRAVGMLMEIVATYPPPIFVNHEIIHNTFVVRMFEKKGVIFEPHLDKIPQGSLVVISAHGTGPSYFAKLRNRSMRWIDATCPLVEKVHREARDLITKGYHILYIGKKGHQEAVGVMDEGKRHFTLIESEEDIERLSTKDAIRGNRGSGVKHCLSDDDKQNIKEQSEKERVGFTPETFGTFGHESTKKYALLTQTTLSIDDTVKLIEKIKIHFPNIILPKSSDICYATTNRQKAMKVLAEKVDIVLVIGSKNSSNSSKLRHVAEEMGKRAYLIDSREDIDTVWFEGVSSVGVTAGASGPEELVEGVVECLKGLDGIFTEELRVVEEKIEFPYTLTIQS